MTRINGSIFYNSKMELYWNWCIFDNHMKDEKQKILMEEI